MSDLADMDATGLAQLFRLGHASPIDTLDAVQARMAAREDVLCAMTAMAPQARAQAEASAARWRDGLPLGPLDGVPVTVKDSLAVAGMAATFGSPAFQNFQPADDELPVARVRATGAVLLGKTNLPEFALEGYTDNALFGATGNPFDPALTPGGSTGGGAASVAAGYAPIGLGTDGGGSLRRPAAHCGLYALKTSIGRIPRRGGLPQLLLDFEVVGALTRTLRDTRLAFDVMAGPDPDVPGSHFPDDVPRPTGSCRVLAVERLGAAPLDPAIAASFQAYVDKLSRAGHHVRAGHLPVSTEALAEVWPQLGPIHLLALFAKNPKLGAKASAKYRRMAEEAARWPATQLVEILARVATSRREAAALFRTVDIVVMPAIAALAWPKADSHPPIIDGQPVGPRGHAVYTGWVNAAGIPALSLPIDPAPDGRAIGVQLIAAFGQDRFLLDLADQIA